MSSTESASSLSDLIGSLHADSYIRGRQFEQIAAWWLKNTTVSPFAPVQVQRVWPWDEWPDRDGPDIGIDLVIQLSDGSLCAAQAKCFDETRDIPKSEIDSFISAATPQIFQHKLLISTTDGLSANARRVLHEQHVVRVMRTDLERSRKIWPKSLDELGEPAREDKATPRPHQSEAIHDVIHGFDTSDRGQLIMACGTGKTLTALWVFEHLQPQVSLVLVPSLSLLSQTVYEWAQNTTQPWSYICVCSDQTVNRKGDEPISTVDEIPFKVTTDPNLIERFIATPGQKVIFCTYQSSEQVAVALSWQKTSFDLVICDEAHRLAGRTDAKYSIALNEERLRAKKRLFMTATPRVYSTLIRTRAEDRGVEVTSMDDEAVFGPVFHRLSFGKAIQSELLSDYRVVIVGVSDEQVQRLIQEREMLSISERVLLDAGTLAAHIGLAKAIKEFDLRKVISFHGRISSAAEFSRVHPLVVDWIPGEERPEGDLWTGTISGEMNAGVRRRILNKLALGGRRRRALVTNARCLTEGIDVPSLDAVAFIEPRSSQVDIIQAVGRAIRKSKEKTVGTIFLPVLVPAGWETTEAIEDGPFKHIWEVLNALKAHDEDLAEDLAQLRLQLGATGSVGSFPPKIIFELPLDVERIAPGFVQAIQTKIIEKTTEGWDSWFGKLKAFSESAGHSSPKKRGDDDLARLGNWVVQQRRRYRRRELAPAKQRRLESLPSWSWDLKSDQISIEEKYQVIRSLSEELGGLPPIRNRVRLDWEGHPVPSYVAQIRTRFRLGQLEEKWIEQFQAIPGWDWRPANQLSWVSNFAILEKFVEREGHANVPQDHQEEGFPLGQWVANQRNQARRESLSEDRKRSLESLPGWTWNKNDASFAAIIEALRSFYERNGHYRIPHQHVENEIHLGRAIKNLRRSYMERPDLFESGRKELVESLPSWDWRPSESQPQKNHEALLSFLEREGHIFPSKAHVENGVHLYGWMNRMRRAYRAGKLPRKQIEALESLPGWNWEYQDSSKRPNSALPPRNRRADTFDQRVEILRAYVIDSGGRLPSLTQKTHEGHSVGQWSGQWRRQWREGSLTHDQVSILEAIPGWKWDPFNDAWERHFQLLVDYCKENGDVRIPIAATYRGIRLGHWVATQRRKRKQNEQASSLELERRARLDSLPGWDWDPMPGRRPKRRDS